jgi:endonuclease/exonuclease/phosphatase family metal-dependent hydrolase
MTAPKPLRVVTYNVRYFGHATRGLASTKRAMARIAEAVASLDPLPDLMCLQEVETRSLRSNALHPVEHDHETQLSRWMDMLRVALHAAKRRDAYEAYYFPAHVYAVGKRANVYTTGLAVIAHRDLVVDHHNAEQPHDITHRRIHALRNLKQTRICAHVRFRRKSGSGGSGSSGETTRQGSSIDVFNTHLSLPSTMAREFWMEEARMGFGKNQLEEARNLARFIERERASDRFLVVGDFNALPGSPVYRYLVDHGYKDPFARVHNMSEGELRSWPTAGFMQLRMHLDHVLTGPGLEWVDFDESHAFGDQTSPFHGLSDHMPLIGRCRTH